LKCEKEWCGEKRGGGAERDEETGKERETATERPQEWAIAKEKFRKQRQRERESARTFKIITRKNQ